MKESVTSGQLDKKTDDFPVETSNSIHNKFGIVIYLCLQDEVYCFDAIYKKFLPK